MISVLIAGNNPASRKVYAEVLKNKHLNFVGFVVDGECIFNETKVLGTLQDIETIVQKYKPNVVVNCFSGKRKPFSLPKTKQVSASEFFETISKKAFLEDLKSDILKTPEHRFDSLERRVLSVSIAIVLTILLAPLLLFISFCIAITTKGSIFFLQERIGFRGKRFKIIKFKTMSDGNDVMKGTFERDSSARITPIGSILRKTHFDELPQLFNILKGDMNFVGPRPEMAENVETMKEQMGYYSLRHLVRPGITGWAQVKYRYAVSKKDVVEKLRYDLYYVKKRSVCFDLFIMIMTAKVVYDELMGKYETTPTKIGQSLRDPTSVLDGCSPNVKMISKFKERNAVQINWERAEYEGHRYRYRSITIPTTSGAPSL